MDAIRAGATVDEVLRRHRHRPVVRRPAAADPRGRDRGGARRDTLTPELLRRAKRHGFSDAQLARAHRIVRRGRPRRAARARGPAGLQDRRHLRGRVRGADAVPLLDVRRGDRGRAADQAGRAHPRQRAEPDRPGHRVRLLLRARLDGAVGGRLRDRDGQLQPRDRLDRLRHLRPAVLRAADPRGRARGGRGRDGGRPGRRGDRPARRADAARAGRTVSRRRACRSSARSPTRSTWPRTAARSATCSPPPACRRRSTAPPRRSREAKAIADEIGYPVLVRPSFVLGGRGMEIVYDDDALRGLHRAGHRDLAVATRCSSTGSSTTRSRSTSTRCTTATSSTSAA